MQCKASKWAFWFPFLFVPQSSSTRITLRHLNPEPTRMKQSDFQLFPTHGTRHTAFHTLLSAQLSVVFAIALRRSNELRDHTRSTMGNIFCGGKEESPKSAAFQPTGSEVAASAQVEAERPPTVVPQHSLPDVNDDPAAQEEDSRVQSILQTAGRGMVSVRSTRGSTAYEDQGFMAHLFHHIQSTIKLPEQLPTSLPPANSNSSVYSRLSKPQWQGIVLGKQQIGLAGCAGENPYTYMDHEALSFLDKVRPKKERLFNGTAPMVENLL